MREGEDSLGSKLRQLRLKKGLTQKELSGERITRNMLSLIESGSASPSVATLLYLAERLETPVGYFFTETSEEENRYLKLAVIGELKALYAKGDNAGCLALGEKLPLAAVDDEIAYILAVCRLHAACRAAERLDLRTANRELDAAGGMGMKSLYCGEDFRRALTYYAALFRAASEEAVPDILCDRSASGAYLSWETVAYFRALSRRQRGEEPEEGSVGVYGDRHLSALRALSEGRVKEAVKKLRELSLDSALPYYMQYRVLCALEDAANESGDLRLAYSSSRRKIELIDRMRF